MGPRLGTPSLLEETADKRLSYVGTFVGRVTVSLSFAGSLKAGADVRAGPGSRVSTGGGSFVVTRGISGATGGASATGSAKRTTGTGVGTGFGWGGYICRTT
jgi:hypothetical protein